jgi:hypothetical protein
MKNQPAVKTGTAFLAVCLCVVSAFPNEMLDAMPRGNWRAVESLAKGTSISVALESGDKMEGKFVGLEPDAIRLNVDDKERIYPLASVVEIRQLRVPDGKANGTLIGLGAGMVAGIIAASVSGTLRTGDSAGRQWGAGLIMAGMGFGALFGCTADAAIKGDRLIYLK